MKINKFDINALKFLRPNDPRLKKVSQEIPQNQINSKSIQKIIETMRGVAYGEQKDQKKPIMVGLAARKLGFLKE